MSDVALVEVTDDDFAVMLRGETFIRSGIAVPPGGVDDPLVLNHVRAILARLRADGFDGGHWMIVANGEAVGLCGFKHPPSPLGEVEIAYGIAASRRSRGHATRALALVAEVARRNDAIAVILAETAVDNLASQRVLEKNSFERSGTRTDAHDGELVIWRKAL